MQLMKRHLLSSVLIVLSVCLAATSIAAQRKGARPKVTAITASGPLLTPEQQKREATFIKAWTTLNENYFDKSFGGLDWNKVRAELLPRARSAKTDAEVHRLIEEMTARLDKSHFALIPPEYYASLRAAQEKAREREKAAAPEVEGPPEKDADPEKDEPAAEARYGIGIELRYIDNRFVITSVEKQSGATIAGLKPGFVLEKINGVALNDLTGRLLTAYPNVRHLQRFMPTYLVAAFLNGEHDVPVLLTCLDEKDELKEYKVPRLALSGQYMTIAQRFPVQYLQFRTESLSDDLGYVKFNVFGLPVVGKFCDALTEFANKKAIIVDLRGNIGGLLGTLIALSGMLSDEPLTIGTALYRYRDELIAASPKAKNFKGKLIFLVDGQSMSAAELFAAGLQESERAVIVGERTAGEALPAGSVELPTGAVLVYPVANFRTAKGRFIEGTGVVPNFAVALDRRSLLDGKDTQLQKALELVHDDKVFVRRAVAEKQTVIEGRPPPPPIKLRKGEGSGTGSGIGAATPPPAAQPAKDPKALQVLADFAAAVGSDAKQKLLVYEADGTARMNNAGSDMLVDYSVFRQSPDKYSIIMTSAVLGEVREIHNGKDAYVQSDYGVDIDTMPFDTTRSHLFAPLTNLTDPALFATLSYLGEYDDDGTPLKLVQGTIQPGLTVAMAFDARTHLLVRCSLPSFSYTLGDYRKVDNLTLPFTIVLGGFMDIRLRSVKLDAKVDPANFQKKEKCFDKPL